MNIEELRAQIAVIREKKDALKLSKMELQARLAYLKNEIRSSGRMAHSHYKQCCDDQRLYVRQLVEVEKQIIPLNRELQRLCQLEHSTYAEQKSNAEAGDSFEVQPMVTQLVALRQSYQDFAADPTRVSSMRQMAAEFVLRLNPIIRSAVNKKA